MKKINLINIITFLFIVLALFIISCEESGNTDTGSGTGGDTDGGTGGDTDGGTGGGTGGGTVCEATDRTALVKCIEDAMRVQKDTITPDLSHIKLGAGLTDLSWLFGSSETFNPLFANAPTTGYDVTTFNGDISKWDTSNVTNMWGIFNGAHAFNQDIGNWNTSNVTNMSYMFRNTTKFNRDISTKEVTVDGASYKAWDVGKVKDMSYMFNSATAFDQDLTSWTWDPAPNSVDVREMFRDADSMVVAKFPKVCAEATNPYPNMSSCLATP